MEKIFVLVSILACLTIADMCNCNIWRPSSCQAASSARNDGSYSATSQSVSVYTEDGAPRGSYTVYLHHGKKYIKFKNTWICIQGKSRFGHNGNWYVIK